MITVNVSYCDQLGYPAADDEVSRIFVVSETEHAVILSVETKTKYPHPNLYGGSSLHFPTLLGNVVKLQVGGLPFQDTVIVAEAGRYNLYVCFFHDVRQDAPQVYDSGVP